MPSPNNFGDISKIKWDEVPAFDLLTYSFPCTDVSDAGRQAGLEEGSGTRSSLLWECRKAIAAKHPKFLLMENVKALVSKKFKPFFLKWLAELESQEYINYWQVLNAKDYGVPQNRERVFCVSILNDGSGQSFKFPEPSPLSMTLGDVLEDKVDDKYYLTDKTSLANFLRTGTFGATGVIEVETADSTVDSTVIPINTAGGGAGENCPRLLLEMWGHLTPSAHRHGNNGCGGI